MHTTPATRTEQILKWLAIVVALAFVGLFAFSATLRLLYPYEVEWMEGSMIDHAIRVLHGLPIYSAPSVDFVPWLYPPAYYHVVAWSMHLIGEGFLAGRLVSVLSTLASCGVLADLVRRATHNTGYAWFAAALYIAAYHATGYYFDIARNDAFFTLVILLVVYAASMRGNIAVIGSALGMVLAFYAKQQAIVFAVPLIVWFFLRGKREGTISALLLLVTFVISIIISNAVTNEWFSYYIFDIPAAKRADFSMLHAMRIVPEYLLGVFAVTSILTLSVLVRRSRQRTFWQSTLGLVTLFWFGSIVAGAMSLGNEGGYKNVMMPFAAFSAALLPITIHELRDSVRVVGYGYVALLLQFGALMFDPTGEKMLFAGNRQRAGAVEIVDRIRELPGDVYIPYHGYLGTQAGKQTHAHILATMDVMRMKDSTASRLSRDFDSAYAHRFSAVIFDESSAFTAATLKGYWNGGKLIGTPNVGLTRVGDEGTRPNLLWIHDTSAVDP
jgi:hypothetical protein